jgi:flagellar basal-body rod protein FlgB
MADPNQMSVFSLMKARMQMLGERQKVVAQNVANVSTPGFVPSDIDQKSFGATLERMAGRGAGGGDRRIWPDRDQNHPAALSRGAQRTARVLG